MIVDKNSIRDYLPQKDPFVMVDAILENDLSSVITCFNPLQDHLFCENGFFTESGLIENMAQTAACKAGFESKKNGSKPLIGFIGAIKNLKIFSLPPVGNTITTHLKITAEVLNIKIASIYIIHNHEKIAECEMKIFLQENNKK